MGEHRKQVASSDDLIRESSVIADSHEFYLAVSIEEVYAFITISENMLSFLPKDPSLTYSDVEVKPDGGYRYRVVYKVMGIKITTLTETVEMIPNEKLVIESKGQINGETIWTLTPVEGGTWVSIHYEYSEPENIFQAVARSYAHVVVRSTLSEIARNARSLIKPRGDV